MGFYGWIVKCKKNVLHLKFHLGRTGYSARNLYRYARFAVGLSVRISSLLVSLSDVGGTAWVGLILTQFYLDYRKTII